MKKRPLWHLGSGTSRNNTPRQEWTWPCKEEGETEGEQCGGDTGRTRPTQELRTHKESEVIPTVSWGTLETQVFGPWEGWQGQILKFSLVLQVNFFLLFRQHLIFCPICLPLQGLASVLNCGITFSTPSYQRNPTRRCSDNRQTLYSALSLALAPTPCPTPASIQTLPRSAWPGRMGCV